MMPSRDGTRRALIEGHHCMNQNLRRRNGPQRAGAWSPPAQRRRQCAAGERYLALGREAQLAGDEVEMERCYQFAEHYFRVMRAANAPGSEGKGTSHARATGDRL